MTFRKSLSFLKVWILPKMVRFLWTKVYKEHDSLFWQLFGFRCTMYIKRFVLIITTSKPSVVVVFIWYNQETLVSINSERKNARKLIIQHTVFIIFIKTLIKDCEMLSNQIMNRFHKIHALIYFKIPSIHLEKYCLICKVFH